MAEANVAGEIDTLYGLPLADFTPARDELARTLRAEGRKEDASEVAALRKPVLAAWVVNRLARTRRADMRELVRAADAVRAGREGAGERLRSALDALTAAARYVLTEDQREPTDAVLRDVATTLRTGAASDPDALGAGRLVRPLEPTGFEGMAGAFVRPPARRAASRPSQTRPDRKRVAKAEQELAAAKDTAKRLRREATAAEREARRLAGDADKAERTVAEAEKRLERARSG